MIPSHIPAHRKPNKLHNLGTLFEGGESEKRDIGDMHNCTRWYAVVHDCRLERRCIECGQPKEPPGEEGKSG